MNYFNKDESFVNYLFTLTDDVGIFQHSIYGIPDPRKGYTTDDNSRALILAVMLYEDKKNLKILSLITKYLSFILNAQNDNGKFKNFMDYNRTFIEKEGSEDCFGRCLWALGRTLSSNCIPENIKRTCKYIIEKSIDNLPNLKFLRAKAYSIIGLTYMDLTDKISRYVDLLGESLVNNYVEYKDDNWNWFEETMSYSNSVLPWSLLRAYYISRKNIFLEVANESIEFLEKITMKENYFKPIGCNGWYEKNKDIAQYDEQPIEACEMLLMYIDYYKITHDFNYLNNAMKCFHWYRGKNSKNLCLIDKEVGACYDGITSTGLNYNQGSECLISYGISLIEVYQTYFLLIND